MKTESFVAYVRDQVFFIIGWTISIILWFILPLTAFSSAATEAELPLFLASVVVGLFLVISGLGTIRRLQLLSKDVPEEDRDTPFSREFVKQPWPIFAGITALTPILVSVAHFYVIFN